MMTSDVKDHLRNHGFLLTSSGWTLSPMYDVNPVPEGYELSLNVSETSNAISIALAIETAPYYDIDENNARAMANEITFVVKNNWEALAKKYGLSRSDIEYMRPAFFACDEII